MKVTLANKKIGKTGKTLSKNIISMYLSSIFEIAKIRVIIKITAIC